MSDAQDLTVKAHGLQSLVGVARRDITPPVGIYARQWGAAEHDVAEGVHRPLTLTALAMLRSPGESPLILLAMDGGWFKVREDEEMIRSAVLQDGALAPSRLRAAWCVCTR